MFYIETITSEKLVLDYVATLQNGYIKPLGDGKNSFCFVICLTEEESEKYAQKLSDLKYSSNEMSYLISIRKEQPSQLPDSEVNKFLRKIRKERTGRNTPIRLLELPMKSLRDMDLHEKITSKQLILCYSLEEIITNLPLRIIWMIMQDKN